MKMLDTWVLSLGLASLVLGAAMAIFGPIALLLAGFVCMVTLVSSLSIQRACLMAIATALLFIVAIPTYGPSFPLKVVAMGTSILVLGIAALRCKPGSLSIRSKSFYGAVAFLLYGVTLAALRGDPGTALVSGAATISAVVGVSLYSSLDDKHRAFLPTLIIGVMTLQVIHAVAEVYVGYSSYFGYMGTASLAADRNNELLSFVPGRATGTLGHPILLGLYCAFAAIVSLAKTVPRTLQVISLTIAILGIVLAGSRSALLGLLLALVVLYFSSSIKHSRTLVILLSTVAGSILVSRYIQSISEYLADVSTTMSFTHRFSVLGTWRILMDRPIFEVVFGGGPQAMRNLLATELVGKNGFLATDNQFLLTLATIGLVGLVAQISVSITSLSSGSPFSRAFMTLSIFMMFSFDSLTWALPTVIFVLGSISFRATASKTPSPINPAVLNTSTNTCPIKSEDRP